MVLFWLVLASAPVVLEGSIPGPVREHPVRVLVWTPGNFLKTPSQSLVIPAGAALTFRFEVDLGQWCVSAFEDENANGKLDMGFFGPREPSGFWRPYSAWRKPRFDDVGRTVDAPMKGIEIILD